MKSLRSMLWRGASPGGLGLLSLLLAGAVQAAGITVVGHWFETIGVEDLTAGAGTDFRPAIENEALPTTVTIANTQGAAWMLWARCRDSSLPAAVSLAVRRTTDGSGDGSISGGMDYLQLTDYEQVLASGVGDRSGIGLRLRLSGVSISQGPGAHGCTLDYRVQ